MSVILRIGKFGLSRIPVLRMLRVIAVAGVASLLLIVRHLARKVALIQVEEKEKGKRPKFEVE